MSASESGAGDSGKWPNPMSIACSAFLDEHLQIATFHFFVLSLAMDKDQRHIHLANAIQQQPNISDANRTALIAAAMQGYGARQALRTTDNLLLGMLFVRAVDNYLNFRYCPSFALQFYSIMV